MRDSVDRSKRTRLDKFGFRTNLVRFLIAELQDFPGRQVAATRLFVTVVIIVAVTESVRMPPTIGALSIVSFLSFDAYANTGQSLFFGLRQFKYLLISVVLSVLTLMATANDPWLMLAVSFVVMVLALFHAQLIAWTTSIAMWFPASVLYYTSTPDENIYRALWNIPSIGILGLGAWTLVHFIIAPQDPYKLLTSGIANQLRVTESIFRYRLLDQNKNEPNLDGIKAAAVGLFSRLQTLLANSESVHMAVRRHHKTYIDLLQEVDGLRQIAQWLDQSLSEEYRNLSGAYRALPMSLEKRAACQALLQTCETLRFGIENHQNTSAQGLAALDNNVLLRHSQGSQQTLLIAFWEALQRIATLVEQLHQPVVTGEIVERVTGGEIHSPFPAWLGYDFWQQNLDSLQFAIKFSLGAILCTLLVQAFDWPGISTAIVTCLVAAQTSLGADYRYTLLRLCGATFGGVCAYFYVLVLQPELDTIVGFLVATAPFWALSAWITAGSTNIAYLGRQFGFAFALFVFHDYGAVEDLFLPRDRVLGVLLGVVVVGVIDYAIWPRRSVSLARQHCVAALRAIAQFSQRLASPEHLISYILPLRVVVEKELLDAQDLLKHAQMEPDALRFDKIRERNALRDIIGNASDLMRLLQIRTRYRLLSNQQFTSFPPKLQQVSHNFDAELLKTMSQIVDMLTNSGHSDLQDITTARDLMEQCYREYLQIASLPMEFAMEWELRFLLDKQILQLLEKLQKTAVKSFVSLS